MKRAEFCTKEVFDSLEKVLIKYLKYMKLEKSVQSIKINFNVIDKNKNELLYDFDNSSLTIEKNGFTMFSIGYAKPNVWGYARLGEEYFEYWHHESFYISYKDYTLEQSYGDYYADDKENYLEINDLSEEQLFMLSLKKEMPEMKEIINELSFLDNFFFTDNKEKEYSEMLDDDIKFCYEENKKLTIWVNYSALDLSDFEVFDHVGFSL